MNSIRKKINQDVFRTEMLSAKQDGASRFTFWFYPETSKKERIQITDKFQKYLLGRDIVQPVTLYGDTNPEPVEVSPLIFQLNTVSVDKMISIYKKIVGACDNIATYKSDNSSFVCAIIFHENEIILQDLR